MPDESTLPATAREVVRTGKMPSRRSEKKREPAADTKILPMELQVGDRLADGASDWEVIAPPYNTTGGRMVHARGQKIDQPASWEIRSWDAAKRVSVKRPTAEQDKR